ncbi:phospholipase D-like domain-containing protein, partial [bacterium]|nr:phospholipase D-like domain-containing protein [bacterium]
ANRGVQVYILVDGYASQNLSKEFVSQLKLSGIHFRRFEPILKSKSFYFGRRLHHKVVVVDFRFALVSGVNISDRYNDLPDDPAWLDWVIFAEGEIVAGLARVCAQLWSRSNIAAKLLISNVSLPAVHKEWKCAVRLRTNDWVQRKNQITRSYLEMFRDASSHIVIMSSYFLPGRLIRRNMSRAARRGVKIRLILAGTSDISLAKNAERYIYRWLFKRNIEVYEYPKTVLHGKLSIYDSKWVTVGSYNVNNISAYASVELNLDVNDAAFAADTEKKLFEIVTRECTLITEEEYKTKFNFIQRVIQRISYDVVRFLFYIFTFYFRQH